MVDRSAHGLAGMSPTRIAVIGGGYAGMSAAVELSRHELDVTVFESGSLLGGRARVVDAGAYTYGNGEHFLAGAYSETLRMLRALGVAPKVFRRLPFAIHTPAGVQLTASTAPAPFGPLLSVFRARGLTLQDRLAMLRLKRALRSATEGSVAQLLVATRQTTVLTEQVWKPFCLAVLGTTADSAAAQAFAYVLRAYLRDSASSELLVPRVDMSELLPVPATLYLSRRGNSVRTLTRIERIRLESGRFTLDGDYGEGSHYSHVIVATQADTAAWLLSGFDSLTLLRNQLQALPTEDISTIYLAYPCAVSLPGPIIQMTDSIVHTVTRRDRTIHGVQELAAIIRTRDAHRDRTDDDLALEAHKVVERFNPHLVMPNWTKVVTERNAIYPATPGAIRPRTITAVPNLLLAGDYLESPGPANIETAVCAGLAAARQILRSLRPA
ncbi:MAG: FAD-dependent oxidoreductase [Uliginosibacterium sp.]|nr:FAD-dependent oxidoreductase [Uliginosibacterium sp.]